MPCSCCWLGMRRRSTSSAMARWPSFAILSSGPCCSVTRRWQCAPRRSACATIPPSSRYVQDIELGGKAIRSLDRTRWFITAANRDPEKFPAPEKFDITRDPNLHIAFGSGIHHCLGATLARVEGQEAFKALVQRFPAVHLETEELEYQPSIIFRSLKSLPVTWH